MEEQVVATHALAFGELSEDSTEERKATRAAILAALPGASAVELQLDHSLLADEYPGLASSISEVFDRRSHTGGSEWYTAQPITDAVGETIDELLAISTYHRYVALGSVRLLRDGTPYLEYNGDHGFLRVDATVETGIADVLEDVFEGYDAGLLPAETLAEWTTNGTTYRIAPPSLCVESTGTLATTERCFDLSRLDGVAADESALRIELKWKRAGTDGGRVGDLVAGVLGAIGGERPRAFEFDDQEAFEIANTAFEKVVKTLGYDSDG